MSLGSALFEQTLIIGIDPGFSGATVVYDPKKNKIIDIQDMPVVSDKHGSTKTRRKPQLVASELAQFIGGYAPLTAMVVMEDVGSMPGQGVVSMFRFGFATGVAHGVVSSYMIPIALIRPAVWKSAMGLNSNKASSIERIKSMFPHESSRFTAKKDGRAEAALLAVFGKRLL